MIGDLFATRTAEKLVATSVSSWLLRSYADGDVPADVIASMGSYLLRSPWSLVRLAKGRSLMQLIRRHALASTTGTGSRRGYALEAATVADQWLAPGNPQERFVFFSCYTLGKDLQPENE